MKRILLLLIILSLNIYAVEFKIGATYKQAGYTLSEKSTDLINGDAVISYDEPIYAVNIEVTQDLEIGEIGVGGSFEQGYKVGDESFDAVPVYGILRFKIPLGEVVPYFNGRYGKTYYQNVQGVVLTDGEFYSIGAGIRIENLEVEASVDGKDGTRNGENFINGGFSLQVRYITY